MEEKDLLLKEQELIRKEMELKAVQAVLDHRSARLDFQEAKIETGIELSTMKQENLRRAIEVCSMAFSKMAALDSTSSAARLNLLGVIEKASEELLEEIKK